MARLAILLSIALAAAAFASPGAARAGPNCSASASLDSEELEVLRLINDYRQDHDLPPLAPSETLSRAASWKSGHMAHNDYFGHDDEGLDRGFVDRLHDCGYNYNTWVGENIAAGHESGADTFDQWRNSPAHEANILNSHYTAVGIGRVYDEGSTYDWYWTTEFGGVDDSSPPPGSEPAGSGDVSCDGRTDSMDAVLVLQHSAGLLTSLRCSDAADVDGNGRVDANDAALILQYDAGLPSSLGR